MLDADRVPGSSRACARARSRLGVKADDVHVHRVSVAVAAGHSDQLSRALPAGVWGPALRVARQTISQLQAVHCAGPFGASCGGWAVGIRGGKRRYKAGGTPPRGRAEERAPERLACRPPSANPLRKHGPLPEADEATATGHIGRLAPGGARAPGPSIDAAAPAAQRRENGTPSAASWERAHVSLSLETASTPKWPPPARAKESGGISALGRAARPRTWVRASRARVSVRAADAGPTELRGSIRRAIVAARATSSSNPKHSEHSRTPRSTRGPSVSPSLLTPLPHTPTSSRLRAVNRPNHVHPLADPVPNLPCSFLVLFHFSSGLLISWDQPIEINR